MTVAAIKDGSSRAVEARDRVLSIFPASKMLATASALRAKLGEPTLDWGSEFYAMPSMFSDRLIYGLSFLVREPNAESVG